MSGHDITAFLSHSIMIHGEWSSKELLSFPLWRQKERDDVSERKRTIERTIKTSAGSDAGKGVAPWECDPRLIRAGVRSRGLCSKAWTGRGPGRRGFLRPCKNLRHPRTSHGRHPFPQANGRQRNRRHPFPQAIGRQEIGRHPPNLCLSPHNTNNGPEKLRAIVLRREGDSNSRSGYPLGAFRVRCHRPLGHLSNETGAKIAKKSIKCQHCQRIRRNLSCTGPSSGIMYFSRVFGPHV